MTALRSLIGIGLFGLALLLVGENLFLRSADDPPANWLWIIAIAAGLLTLSYTVLPKTKPAKEEFEFPDCEESDQAKAFLAANPDIRFNPQNSQSQEHLAYQLAMFALNGRGTHGSSELLKEEKYSDYFHSVLPIFLTETRDPETGRVKPEYLEKYTGNVYEFRLAQVSKKSKSGQKRRDLIADLRDDDKLYLVREPDNPDDRNAICVMCERLGDIGYLAEGVAINQVDRFDNHTHDFDIVGHKVEPFGDDPKRQKLGVALSVKITRNYDKEDAFKAAQGAERSPL